LSAESPLLELQQLISGFNHLIDNISAGPRQGNKGKKDAWMVFEEV
jgi:hypothetical protein